MDGHRRMRALVADEQPIFRLGIRGELEDAGFLVCSEAGTAGEAVLAAIACEPDVCLVDVALPGGGLEAVRAISSRLPRTKVLMLTETMEEPDCIAAIQAGASGYVEKDMDPSRLPEVVRAVVAGEPAIPRRFVRQLLEHAGLAH